MLKAIVTGGSSGIGEATVKLLKEHNVKVFVFDKTMPQKNIQGVEYIICDITNKNEVNENIQNVCRDGLDILINNAGIGTDGNVLESSDAEWHKVLDVNVVGTARMSAAVIPFLKNSSNAAIVNVSSTVSIRGFTNVAVYSASKGAINSLTLAMAADHIKDNIRVNAVVPATVDSPWVERFLNNSKDPENDKKILIDMQPMKRLVSLNEVANAICYLALPLSKSTTATILNVDGGVTGLRI